MSTLTKTPITSGELGILWMVYQTSTTLYRMTEQFIGMTDNDEAKKILTTFMEDSNNIIIDVEKILKGENAVIPVGFDENDVVKAAPPLFDNLFHIMFLRFMTKININLSSLRIGMSVRKDVRQLFERKHANNLKTYNECTDYLLEKGVLAQSPHVTMPTMVEYVEDESYMRGFNLFEHKRALNTIEVGLLFQSLEANVLGMQLITGFAQVAREDEVRNYFIRGKELAKKIVMEFNDLFLQSDIQPPSTWAGKATNSTIPPFSDKLMMHIINFLSNNALGITGLQSSFSLRSDLPPKLGLLGKDIFMYAREGGQMMIRHKWMEEPPQMEDRNQLTKSKK